MKKVKTKLTIISGLSGSGKTSAIHALEDRGYFCVDNLPVSLIPGLVELFENHEEKPKNIALGIDAREGAFLSDFFNIADGLEEKGHKIDIIFLEAKPQTLVRRFSETRRRHPLGKAGDIYAALEDEAKLLAPLKENARFIIDTSGLNVHQLKRQIRAMVEEDLLDATMTINLLSFGFKYGVPLETDLLFDVRCLPNPYFIRELKRQTGLQDDVFNYVMRFDESRRILEKVEEYLALTLPLYQKEGKSVLTVAFGCTGGKHRSVTFARAAMEYLEKYFEHYAIRVFHRDIEK